MGIGNTNEEYGRVRASNIEQNEYEKELWAKRVTEIPNNLQFRAEYTSTDGLPDYVGYAPMGLGEGVNGWILKKYTYDANRQCTVIQVCTSSNWTARASTAVYS